MSVVWAIDILVRENLFNIRFLWEGYPHSDMTFMFKFYFIVQLAYWLHVYPELYFQKVKREDMPARIQYASLYFVFILGAYVFSYTRVALCLLILQYAVESIFHASRLLSYADKTDIANPLYKLHDVCFVLARLGSISLAFLTFWYGLALAPAEFQKVDFATGNFNTSVFRLNALIAVCLLQAWLMWNFITFHLRRMREAKSAASEAKSSSVGRKKTQQEKAKARKENKKSEDDKDKDEYLPEVDQDTKKTLRQRK